jgi:hypothetical protein
VITGFGVSWIVIFFGECRKLQNADFVAFLPFAIRFLAGITNFSREYVSALEQPSGVPRHQAQGSSLLRSLRCDRVSLLGDNRTMSRASVSAMAAPRAPEVQST